MDKSTLHDLLASIDPLDDNAILHRKLDTIMRALALVIRLNERMERQMAAYDDIVSALTRLEQWVAQAKTEKASIAQTVAERDAAMAERDALNTRMQELLDRVNAISTEN